jgi:heme A synthase
VAQRSPFSQLAWAFVGYLLLVILFGAWVRISFSGAGCGDHWPLCNGEVIPTAPSTERVIEFTHRITSGLCGVFGIALMVTAWRRFGKGHRVTRACVATFFFILVEGAIGAALVKLELVNRDTSSLRALVVALHLGNTLLLTAAATLTAWWSGPQRLEPPKRVADPARVHTFFFILALGTIILTSMTGAVTALGDTVFPVGSAEAAAAAGHILVQLRLLHPLLAIATALGLFGLVAAILRAEPGTEVQRWSRLLGGIVASQVVFGFVNIGLGAPTWAQLTHLLLGQAVWIATVVTAAAALSARPKVAG